MRIISGRSRRSPERGRGGGASVIVYLDDSFTRANDAASAGVAPTGQPWQKSGTGLWGINGNQLYYPGELSGRGFSIIDPGVGSHNAVARYNIPVNTADAGIIFRWSDDTHYWVIFNSGTKYELMKRIDISTYVLVDDTTGIYAPLGNETFEVAMAGDLISVKFGGIEFLSANDPYNNTSRLVGYTSVSTAQRFDNISVKSA